MARWVQAALLQRLASAHGAPTQPAYAQVVPGIPLAFPRDFGAHPDYRTEWWYLTGWLARGGAAQPDCGFQITFFRSRTGHPADDPSRFAPTQLLFAHAALALPEHARLLHDQRAARQGFGLAQASIDDTAVSIGSWSLRRMPDDHYRGVITADSFRLALDFRPDRPPVLQGDHGYSRKGPDAGQASDYYSRPHLAVSGTIDVDPAALRADRPPTGGPASHPLGLRDAAGPVQVNGEAWLDHEWSSEILARQASGWDWVGLNLADGTGLMAFRIRARDTDRPLWTQYRWIPAAGAPGATPPPAAAASAVTSTVTSVPQTHAGDAPTDAARFEPLRYWTSPRTGVRYPVAMRLTVGGRTLDLEPLFDDQELDSRASTGALYWEGAVRVRERERQVGLGYLELTGYGEAIRF